jgi:hypothetical protein
VDEKVGMFLWTVVRAAVIEMFKSDFNISATQFLAIFMRCHYIYYKDFLSFFIGIIYTKLVSVYIKLPTDYEVSATITSNASSPNREVWTDQAGSERTSI